MGFCLDAVLHVLLPRACVHCRRDLPLGDDGPLCRDCVLPPPPRPACLRCGATLGSQGGFCAACTGRLFACRVARSASTYRGPAASLVAAFKFRGLPSAAKEAGRAMAREFPRLPEFSGFDALVPVPLHPSRRRERGYNQAELLAREVGAATGLPLLDVLERRRAQAPSWRLGRPERRRRLEGAFTTRPGGGDAASGRRLLLIDDVCASSTTLEECALALRRAGARDVAGYAFARAGRFT